LAVDVSFLEKDFASHLPLTCLSLASHLPMLCLYTACGLVEVSFFYTTNGIKCVRQYYYYYLWYEL